MVTKIYLTYIPDTSTAMPIRSPKGDLCFGIFLSAEKTCPCLSTCEAWIGFEPLEIETPFSDDFLFQ